MEEKENIISKETVIESKKFYFDVRENHKGRFLRLTEKHSYKKNHIIIPITGIKTVMSILNEVEEELGKLEPINERE